MKTSTFLSKIPMIQSLMQSLIRYRHDKDEKSYQKCATELTKLLLELRNVIILGDLP